MPAPPTASTGRDAVSPRPYHIMTKPVGPICNLDCKYCFYLEKEALFPSTERFRMSDEVLEQYIKEYIASQPTPEVNFAWQGGEPTLLGVDYFAKIVELQKKHAQGKKIANAMQTNGTLLNDAWGELLARNHFLVGLSMDGPAELHDQYRVDKRGRPSFDRVMKGLEVLKKHGAEFNTLTVVNRANAKEPLKVYRFLKEVGSGFLQFIPLVERRADARASELGLDLATPPEPGTASASPVTDWSVDAHDYGAFLVAIFDEWVARDVGTTFVQLFDVALGNWMGLGGGLCVFSETCGLAVAMEHNGDVYSCDHYVYPRYKLGNLLNQSLNEMVLSPQQVKFGNDKRDSLPGFCRRCEVKFACHGECPKHRFINTPDGEPGLNYLCPGYKRFFNHVDPYMRIMADLLRAGRPASDIMNWIRMERQSRSAASSSRSSAVDPNSPCRCGSGKKYRRCCGAGKA